MPTLYPYQVEASRWLSRQRRALLSLDCGLGKTAVSIHAAKTSGMRTVLILCPAVAVSNWRKELEMWKADFYHEVTSYSSTHHLDPTESWDLIILDESHYLKSPEAKRTKVVFGKTGLVRRCKRVWCLSGTPMPNNPSELWPMLYTFGQTNLVYSDFIKRYCTTRLVDGKHVQITGTVKESIPELRALLKPISYRKTKEQVGLELPPITFESIRLEGSSPKPIYDFLAKDVSAQDIIKRLHQEAASIKDVMDDDELLSQVNSVSTLRRFNGLRKVAATIELVTGELNSHDYPKIVIFAHHRDVVKKLCEGLGCFGAESITGDSSPKERDRIITSFQQTPELRVLIANIQAAGTAITLTAANQILFIEQDWTPGNNFQAAMRCHRIGQKFPVTVRVAVLDDFIDDRINSTLMRKQRDLAAVIS